MASVLDFQIVMGPDGRLPEPETFRGTVREAREHFFALLDQRHPAIDHASLSLVASPDDPSTQPASLIPYILIQRDSHYTLRYLVSHTGAPAGEPWLPDDSPALLD